jgi:hypothetical protein
MRNYSTSLPITFNFDCKNTVKPLTEMKAVKDIVEELKLLVKSMPKTADNKKETNRKVQILFENLIQ